MFAPEAGEILGDLDGTHVGREDVKEDGNAAHGDFGGGIDVVEFLDAKGNVRGIAEFVRNFRCLAIGEVEAFGSVFVEEVLMGRAEPGLEYAFHRFVFYVFVAESPMADLFDEMAAVFVVDGRQSEFRAPMGEEIKAQNPLFGGMVPVV